MSRGDASFSLQKDNLKNTFQARDAASSIPRLIDLGFDGQLGSFLRIMIYGCYGYLPSKIDRRTKVGRELDEATEALISAAYRFDAARKAATGR